MKNTVLLFAVLISLLSISNIYSQGIPQTINYQGVLKDAAGVVVPNGDYSITFKLYDLPSGGSALWNETKTINVLGGIVNTQLGSVTPITSATIVGAAWLGITIGTGSELIPRITLSSVPYSIMSLTVPSGSITAIKIADAQVVKSLNGLKDNVNLVAGSNVTITPSGNNLTINATGGGGGTIGGSGTANYISKFTNSTTLGNSTLFDAGDRIGVSTVTPNFSLTVNSTPTLGLGLQVSRANGGLIGLSILEASQPTTLQGWSFEVFNQKLKINATGDNGITTLNNLMTFDRKGNVGIGTETPSYPLHVATNTKHAGYFTSDSASSATHVIHGEYTGLISDAVGVYGKSAPSNNYGYGGYFEGGFIGARGNVTSLGPGNFYGVRGSVSGGSGYNYALYGTVTSGTQNNYGVYASASGGTVNWAGYFSGNVNVTGTLSKGGGSFKIDHPLDPTNKNLYHSFVESPDMMNIYNGNIITDASGYATVTMPDWFEALNKEFRYQLTVIGDFAQAIISQKIQNNQFIIRTDKPGIEVSWQVTGIRHDKFAEKYRIPVEENKTGKDVGKYLHPDAYGVDETLGVDYENNKVNRDKK